MLQSGKMNFVVDGQFGSTGKGLIASYLARKYDVKHVASCNLPNAGHTAVNEKGEDYISKAMPVCGILNKWYDQNVELWLGPTGGFTIDRLFYELKECCMNTKRDMPRIHIHPRCGVVTEAHAEQEGIATKHIASTMQGSGSMLAEKVMRGSNVRLARDYAELKPYVDFVFEDNVHMKLDMKNTFLFEGAQGFSLGINHGHSYPTCTSRECTALQGAADMGINASQIGEVIMVIRPYPIRVGNVIENNEQVGYSGDWYPDSVETSFEEINAPIELTTVTKRPRRIATFSWIEVVRAAKINGATQIALNFANQLDPSCFGGGDPNQSVVAFINEVENKTGLPVTLVGTGPRIDHVLTHV